jgi:hypothetical protein
MALSCPTRADLLPVIPGRALGKPAAAMLATIQVRFARFDGDDLFTDMMVGLISHRVHVNGERRAASGEHELRIVLFSPVPIHEFP